MDREATLLAACLLDTAGTLPRLSKLRLGAALWDDSWAVLAPAVAARTLCGVSDLGLVRACICEIAEAHAALPSRASTALRHLALDECYVDRAHDDARKPAFNDVLAQLLRPHGAVSSLRVGETPGMGVAQSELEALAAAAPSLRVLVLLTATTRPSGAFAFRASQSACARCARRPRRTTEGKRAPAL